MGLDDIDEDDAPAPPVAYAGGSTGGSNNVFDAFDDLTGGSPAAAAKPAVPADDLDFFLSGPPVAAKPAAQSPVGTASSGVRGQPQQPKANDDLLDIFSNIHITNPAPGAGATNAVPVVPVVNATQAPAKGGMFGDMSKLLDGMTNSMKADQNKGLGLPDDGIKGPSLKELRSAKGTAGGPTYGSNANGFFDLLNYYELLGVSRTASFDEIRAAYKAKSLKLHPDRHPDQHQDDKELYKRVTDAYNVISDETSRREYDLALMQGTMMGQGGPGGPGGPGPMGGGMAGFP